MGRASLIILMALISVAPVPAFAQDDDLVLRHFRAGQRAAAAQHTDEAIAEFRQALKLNPALVQARANLGLMYYLGGRYPEAINELVKAAKASPQILPAQLFLGLSYIKLAQPEKALTPLKAAMRLDPANEEAAKGLLACYRALGRYDKAWHALQNLALLSRDRASQENTLYLVGQGYLQMGTELTEHLAQKFPSSPWTYRLAGDLASDRGDAQAAAESYRKAGVDGVPLKENPEEAADVFARRVTAHPNDAEALYRLIRAYTVLGDGCFRRLTEQFSDSARAHQLQGEIFRLREDFAAAQKELAIASSKLPDDADLHQSLGEADLRLERLDEAKLELERAAALSFANAETYFLLAQVLMKQSDMTAAAVQLRQALHYDPGLIQAHGLLGRALLRLNQPAAAIPELQKDLDFDYYGDLHFLLYRAYAAVGKEALGQQALAQSKELRKRAFANSVAKVGGEKPPAE